MTTSSTEKHSIRDHHQYNYPSFSSTLLEEVYRSFDQEGDHNHRTDRIMMTTATMKKSSSCYMDRDPDDCHRLRANRFFAVDRWIENEKINLRRKSTPPAVHSDLCDDRRRINHSSSTSSSDSSSGIGGFSSSDTESSAKSKKKLPAALLKPIRTTQNPPENHRKSYSDEIPAQKKKKSKEGNLQRRALKLYSDLKKVKQPISPGGKLASFLTSLFHSNNSKKPHISSSPSASNLERESPATTSRSCLSKTPSSAGRFERRSVRFVDDDDCRGHERKCNVAKHDSSILAGDEEFRLQIKEKHRRVEEVAKELLRNYHHHNKTELPVNIVADHTNSSRKFDRNVVSNNVRDFEDDEEEEEEEDDDDDDVSCCSSDLFELENFLEIGIADRYREELPVYETTHVDTNRAIAKGFILQS